MPAPGAVGRERQYRNRRPGDEHRDGPLTGAGLSVAGAAVRPDGHGDLRTLAHAADTALYAAKRAGRNRVGIGAVPAADTPIASGTAGVEQAGSPQAPSGCSASPHR